MPEAESIRGTAPFNATALKKEAPIEQLQLRQQAFEKAAQLVLGVTLPPPAPTSPQEPIYDLKPLLTLIAQKYRCSQKTALQKLSRAETLCATYEQNLENHKTAISFGNDTLLITDAPGLTLTPKQALDYANIAFYETTSAVRFQYPAWFLSLEGYEKEYLSKKMQDILKNLAISQPNERIARIQEYFKTHPQSTTLHRHGGLTNARLHTLTINGENIPTRIRYGTPVPYDLMNLSDSKNEEIVTMTMDNIKQILQTRDPLPGWPPIPVLLQSLHDDGFSPEGKMEIIKDEAIRRLKEDPEISGKYQLISTAHTTNAARFFSSTDKNKQAVIDVGLSALKNKNLPEQHRSLIEKALSEYITLEERGLYQLPILGPMAAIINTLTSPTQAHSNRHLHMAALEQLIISYSGGISGSSCKSGKDRESCLQIYTDALLIFAHDHQGKLPSLESPRSPDRDPFSEIVATLFLSGHHQELANYNAPGARGIKKPWDNFPKYIIDAIEQKHQEQHPNNNIPSITQSNEAIASLNKPQASYDLNTFHLSRPDPTRNNRAKKLGLGLGFALFSPITIPLSLLFESIKVSFKIVYAIHATLPLSPPVFIVIQLLAALIALTGIPALISWATQATHHIHQGLQTKKNQKRLLTSETEFKNSFSPPIVSHAGPHSDLSSSAQTFIPSQLPPPAADTPLLPPAPQPLSTQQSEDSALLRLRGPRGPRGPGTQ